MANDTPKPYTNAEALLEMFSQNTVDIIYADNIGLFLSLSCSDNCPYEDSTPPLSACKKCLERWLALPFTGEFEATERGFKAT